MARGTASSESPVGVESETLSAALRAPKYVLKVGALPEYDFVVFLVDVGVLVDLSYFDILPLKVCSDRSECEGEQKAHENEFQCEGVHGGGRFPFDMCIDWNATMVMFLRVNRIDRVRFS